MSVTGNHILTGGLGEATPPFGGTPFIVREPPKAANWTSDGSATVLGGGAAGATIQATGVCTEPNPSFGGLHIVLVEPEIPANTGNIARTCAVTGTTLHLVEPLGFSLEDRYLRRAGLDYWPQVRVKVWPDYPSVRRAYPAGRFFYATTRASRFYHQVGYADGDFLVFGKETAGLPADIWKGEEERVLRIPIREGTRSHNLSNAVAIILYEALRQLSFPGLG